MATYVVRAKNCVVRNNHTITASKRGDLKIGQRIEVTDQQDGYGFTLTPIKGWVDMKDLALNNDPATLGDTYIVTSFSTVVRNEPWPAGANRGNLKKGLIIKVSRLQSGYGFSEAPIKGWIRMTDIARVDTTSPPVAMFYSVATTSAAVRNAPTPTSPKRGNLVHGKKIEITRREDGYGFSEAPIKGWIKMSDLAWVDTTAEQAKAFEPGKFNLYRALYGNIRPDILWLDQNLRSFDIIPLLPNPKLEKDHSLPLDTGQVNAIRRLNPAGGGYTAEEKFSWLVDNDGTRDVMAYDPDARTYRIPTPGISGGALVHVIDVVGKFAVVETISGTIPDHLPDYLLFTWYGFAETTLFTPYGGVKFPILFSQPTAYLPFKWLTKVIQDS